MRHYTHIPITMNLSSHRPQRPEPIRPKQETVSIKLTPDDSSKDWEVEVESSIKRKSTLATLLTSVAKLLPYLSPRKTDAVTGIPMRKLMTASVKDEKLLNLIPAEGEIAHTLHLERINNRVRVTAHANCAPDQLQEIVNILHPVLSPSMVGSESAREICVVADYD